MEKILIEERFIIEYILQQIENLKTTPIDIENAKYHHNIGYSKVVSALRNGLLSQKELMRLRIVNYPKNIIDILDDTTSHVNGLNGISLSIVGLTDLYRDEEEYDPFNPECVDILISDNIKTFRNGQNYGNEFIAESIIYPEKIRSIDIRILKYLKNLILKEDYCNDDIITKYNNLIQIASFLQSRNSLIPIREMSNCSNTALDVKKLSEMPILIKK